MLMPSETLFENQRLVDDARITCGELAEEGYVPIFYSASAVNGVLTYTELTEMKAASNLKDK